MIKKSIKYRDFNGDEQVEEHYFNISKAEAIELEASEEQGMGNVLVQMTETRDRGSMVAFFKRFILMSYGQKSADGRSFIKTDENGRRLSDAFVQTAAYDALFWEVTNDNVAGAAFIKGILPAELFDNAAVEQDKPTGLPPRPASVTQLPPPAL